MEEKRKHYDISNYEKPLVTVDIVIFTIKDHDLKILLVKRKYEPFKGYWALPGGFVRTKEPLENAAMRELHEETNVEDVYLEQLYSFGEVTRDPRGRVITVSYFALINSEHLDLKARTDVEDVNWFSMYNLPKELAFDHKKILNYALTRLRNKLDYTTATFQLLPKRFTLTELQKVYEIILNKSVDKRNFRKKIKSLNLLIETKETKMDGTHRPARLYLLKKNAPFII